MAYEHESKLPFAFDRSVGKDEQQAVIPYGLNPYIQGAEFIEAQSIARARHNRVGRLVAKDGDRIERADAVVDVDAGKITLTSGRIYVSGDVLPVPEKVITNVPMTGRVEVGVRLVKSWLTSEDDPTLLGLVPGTDAEGEPGAAREVHRIKWALSTDSGAGDFFGVYIVQDGTILDQKGPSLLEPAMQAIALYDRAHGNYVVDGCRVTALGKNAGKQAFSIEQGEANINGFKRTRFAALRIEVEEDWDEYAIPGETQIYTGGASMTFQVVNFPIGIINSVLLTKQKTVSITRGAVAHGRDALPDSSILSIVSIDGFTAGTSYVLTGNTVDWAPAGPEPSAGSTYSVTYRYRESVTPTEVTDRTFKVSGGAAGGEVIYSYTAKMPRVDRIGLREDGSAVYILGVSARNNPVPPIVPGNVLELATVTNDWIAAPLSRTKRFGPTPTSRSADTSTASWTWIA